MGLMSIIKGIITFPFRIFRRKKEDVDTVPLQPLSELPPQSSGQQLTSESVRNYRGNSEEITKSKLDLIIAELDTLKSLNTALNERLKLIERRLEERDKGTRYF